MNRVPKPKKRLPKTLADFEGRETFVKHMLSESSKGSVLVGAQFLDDTLASLLTVFLGQDSGRRKIAEELSGPMQPLGSFSARIKLGYCLSLYEKPLYEDLNVIRDVRNQFAHLLPPLSFDHPWVEQEIRSLSILEELYSGFWGENGVTKQLLDQGVIKPDTNPNFVGFACAVAGIAHRLEKRLKQLLGINEPLEKAH